MHVTLLMAITINGFIADQHDDTEWVKDLDSLAQTIKEFGVVVLGKRTYDECMKFDAFPYSDAVNVVLTHEEELLKKSTDEVIFTKETPTQLLQTLSARGFNKALLIGGGHLNASFMKENLINELRLDIHPLVFDKGISVFEGVFEKKNLELLGYEQINDQIIQVRYQISQ